MNVVQSLQFVKPNFKVRWRFARLIGKSFHLTRQAVIIRVGRRRIFEIVRPLGDDRPKRQYTYYHSECHADHYGLSQKTWVFIIGKRNSADNYRYGEADESKPFNQASISACATREDRCRCKGIERPLVEFDEPWIDLGACAHLRKPPLISGIVPRFLSRVAIVMPSRHFREASTPARIVFQAPQGRTGSVASVLLSLICVRAYHACRPGILRAIA